MLSWFPKSFATRSDFLLLLLLVYGSLIDTTNAVDIDAVCLLNSLHIYLTIGENI